MRYRVLGPVAAFAGDCTVLQLGGPRQRLVLALLVKDVGRTVPDDAFVDALWPDGPPAGARHTLQTYVSELRRVLDDAIRRVAGGYVLEASRDDVDVWRFEALLAEARKRLGEVPAEASALLREALALWHGEPYADLRDVLALQAEVHRLGQERLEAVEDRIQADLEAGRHAQLATELEALARDHPYRERLHALLMLALYRSSRQAEALRAYERARRVLGEELGLDPSPELQRLQRQILNQDPALLPREVTAAADVPTIVRGFELRTRIARRGPATVWRAYQPSASRDVTVTAIAAHEANTSAFVRSFEPCAQRLATLRHPHLLRLLDHWRDPRGAYLVTPSVGGASVRTTLVDGPWSLPAMTRLVEQVGAALTVLHDAHLFHGDVDADTVLLDEHGNAHLTTTGVILGTTPRPQALAPEVRQGRPASAATDVYGLAVLALEVLTARPAPQADPPLTALEDAGVVAPPGVEQVLAHALAPEPASLPSSPPACRALSRRRDRHGPGSAARPTWTALRDRYGQVALRPLVAFGRPRVRPGHAADPAPGEGPARSDQAGLAGTPRDAQRPHSDAVLGGQGTCGPALRWLGVPQRPRCKVLNRALPRRPHEPSLMLGALALIWLVLHFGEFT